MKIVPCCVCNNKQMATLQHWNYDNKAQNNFLFCNKVKPGNEKKKIRLKSVDNLTFSMVFGENYQSRDLAHPKGAGPDWLPNGPSGDNLHRPSKNQF